MAALYADECEVYKICCPKCNHIYFRILGEDKECPSCLRSGEKVLGVRVAGGHFEVERTMNDLFDEVHKAKEEEERLRQLRARSSKK